MIRQKHRYVLVRVTGEAAELPDLSDAVQLELLREIGSLEYHKVNPKVISWEPNLMMIRCSLQGLGKLALALAMIKRVNGRTAAFYTVRTSGTIRALLAKKKLLYG